ncbi:flagellin domain protein [Thermocrinis albus DSM 14484]|uniref:Flagellin n=1 Tax=Thermocrinis albus (strain DSM 14484 / JCM 11386 / HI 11/12) TaxID=638303 RepID=D3SMU1_THEAH|nr:flagellin [Thermocrinis albus]ADC90071.1 flagellin domain protein [Thermocrinis albus DSM 14484]
MALRVNFNYEAASTHTAILRNEREMNKSLLRLSTGMRILDASDDAAGLFIADQLSIVAAGLERGNQNIQTGISSLRIAENAAGQIFDRLRAIYSRALSAANDINDPNARASLQQEINNLVDAIQKIGTDTEYNGIKLLDGSFTNKYIHYGPRMNQTVLVSIGDVRAQSLGAYMVTGSGNVYSGATALPTTNTDFTVDANEYLQVAGQYVVGGTSGYGPGLVDAATVAKNINNNPTLQSMGIEATATNRSVANTFTSLVTYNNASGASVTLNFYVGSSTTPVFSISGLNETTTLQQLVDAINSQASASGAPITASIDNGRLVLKTTNGETIAVEATVTGATFGANGSVTVNLDQILQGAQAQQVTANGSSVYAVKVGQLNIAGTDSFSVSISTGLGGLGITSTTPTFKNLYTISVMDNTGAEQALLIVKKAQQKVDKVRAQIGAVMNNLQSIFDAQKTALDNTQEAENVIRNTDYAQEMSSFTKLQIKMQASMAMLAQANQLPQMVLQLLR